jgi:hypothetical protein
MGCVLAWSVLHNVNRPLAVILNEVKNLSQARGLLMASFACYKAMLQGENVPHCVGFAVVTSTASP